MTVWSAETLGIRAVSLAQKEEPPESAEHALQELRRTSDLEPPASVAWLRQIHSDRVYEVEGAGFAGDGDALVTSRRDLALCVVTADCVPVLLDTGSQIAAIHAGWRGLQSGIIAKTARRLRPASSSSWRAWIGPAIGPCCYEVGEEVAQAVENASGARIRIEVPNRNPRIDLVAAAQAQLRASGCDDISTSDVCTRCNTDSHSYRRDGAGCGRNYNLVWLHGG